MGGNGVIIRGWRRTQAGAEMGNLHGRLESTYHQYAVVGAQFEREGCDDGSGRN